jgi:hypothetical protein
MGEYFEALKSLSHTVAGIIRHGFYVCEAWRK